jgi:cell division protein FtsB
MPAPPEIRRLRSVCPESPVPLRRRQVSLPAPSRSIWRRALNYLLLFAVAVLLVDALVGERGLVATTRARKASVELDTEVLRLRRENAGLRERARRLKEDPTTIESKAREELGLIRPGEILVVVKDVKGSNR